ncbi:hypothetical protein AVEN_173738-1, partial [Araneus ventricosus]
MSSVLDDCRYKVANGRVTAYVFYLEVSAYGRQWEADLYI